MREIKTDVVVIGGGPAGLAAAQGAVEGGAESVIIIERDNVLGGILNQCIHPGFGLHHFNEELTGPEYAARFVNNISKKTRVMLNTMALSINENLEIVAVGEEDGLVRIKAGSIVLAMGCRERSRGALSIPGTRPAGIFSAGTAQKLVNMDGLMPGKEVLILGSGDIGLIMARRMAYEGAKVHAVCELMPYSSGLARNIAQCLDDLDIPLMLSHTAVQIHGKDRLEGVTIAKVDKGLKPIKGTEQYFKCDTLLLSVGLIPENELSRNLGIKLHPVTGGPVVDSRFMTSVPGIYACGNVLHVHDLVDFVTDESLSAGRWAARGASEHGRERVDFIPDGAVRYTVPQFAYRVDNKVTLRFRVGSVIKNARINVTSGDETLLSARRRICTPGEMESIDIDLGGRHFEEVTVSVTEAKA